MKLKVSERISNFLHLANENIYIIWSLLILSSYAILYKFSFLDRSLGFNWNEVFKNVDITEIFLLMFLCIVLSYVLSNIKFELNDRLKPLLIFSGAFLLGAMFWSAPEISPDTARYFTEAKYLKEYGIVSFIKDWGGKLQALGNYFVLADFPAVPFIFGLIFKFVGESKIYILIFTTSMFALTFIITYLIGEKLWNKNTGMYAGLLLLSSPYLISRSSLTLTEIPLMFFVAAAVYATLNALETGKSKIWILASVTFIVLVFLSKISAWIMLCTVPAIFLIYYIKRSRTIIYPATLITLLSGALIFMFVIYKIDVFVDLPREISGFVEIHIVRFHEPPWSLLFFQINPLVTLMAVFSSYIAFKKRDLNYILLLSWFLIPFIFLHSSRIRYMVPAIPAIALMASMTLGEIKSRKFLASGVILCSLVLAFFAYLPFMHSYSTMNIKNAAEYTNTLNVDKVEFYAIFPEDYYYSLKVLVPLFDIYSDKDIVTPEYDPAYIKPAHASWTWEYRYPPYYSRESSPTNSIVIVSPTIEQELPEKLEERLESEYKLTRIYSAGYFSSIRPYIVRVYVPKPRIIITYPEGGESLNGTQVITWFSSASTQEQRFKIEVCKNICIEVGSIYNRWFYIWEIDPENFPPSNDYKIKILATDDNWQTFTWNESEIFSIVE